MTDILDQIRKVGWLAVEAGLLLVLLCVLLSIILGADSGAFVSSVAKNATSFVQALPPGVFIGVVLIIALYLFVQSARQR